jgi:hypothetical protein
MKNKISGMFTFTLFFYLSVITVSAQKLVNKNIFNGSDLSSWDVVIRDKGIVEDQEIFTVHDNMIHVYENQTDNSLQPFGGILSKDEYSNFHLSLEYKWGKKKFKPRDLMVKDAGILFHIKNDVSIWPSSIECQIQEGDTGDMWIIKAKASSKVNNVIENYDPKGDLKTKGIKDGFARFIRAYCWEKPGWNKVDVIVNGDHAVYKVNGNIVNEAIDMKRWNDNAGEWEPRLDGKILLQAEGAEIFYRNISITEID